MSLIIEIDPHGRERTSFQDFRNQLQEEGRTFTEAELHRLPYCHLVFAAIANAGAAMCPLDLVVAEKQRRRKRFVAMSPDTQGSARRYLKSEGLYADVRKAIEMRRALPWETYPLRAQLWLKLNCLYSHGDNPADRLADAALLILEARQAQQLDKPTARHFQEIIDYLAIYHPATGASEQFRSRMGGACEDLLDRLTEEEAALVEHPLVSDYGCTSDCYRSF